MAFLDVRHIEKHFGATRVLEDISFSLEKGQVLAIIGSSGSGKTTLLRCLNFLETPDRGAILVGGETLFDAADARFHKEKEIRRKRLHFGLVFQSFHLFPQYTALQNVMLARELLAKEQPDYRENRRAIHQAIEKQARELLIQMGLEDRMKSYPHQLSGGQQQRVSIGRALMNAPMVVLADEPTGNLDSKNSQEIVELLKLSNRKYNQTLIVITHDENIALQADRVIAIEDGKITRDEVIRK